jgi:hypothetical protein
MNDGVVALAFDRAVRPFGVLPVGAGSPFPPLREVPEVHRSWRGREHQRAGNQFFWWWTWRARRALSHDLVNIHRLFGGGDVARRLDEGAELGVGDVGLVHPEAIDAHAVSRLLVGPAKLTVGAHGELAAGDPYHARRGRDVLQQFDGAVGSRKSAANEGGEKESASHDSLHRTRKTSQRQFLCRFGAAESNGRGRSATVLP